MTQIPSQRAPEPYLPRTWEQNGLGPDSVVDLGDGTTLSLGELLGAKPEDYDDDHDR